MIGEDFLTCPYCGSGNVREIPHKVGHRAVLADDLLKGEEVSFLPVYQVLEEIDEREMEEVEIGCFLH